MLATCRPVRLGRLLFCEVAVDPLQLVITFFDFEKINDLSELEILLYVVHILPNRITAPNSMHKRIIQEHLLSRSFSSSDFFLLAMRPKGPDSTPRSLSSAVMWGIGEHMSKLVRVSVSSDSRPL